MSRSTLAKLFIWVALTAPVGSCTFDEVSVKANETWTSIKTSTQQAFTSEKIDSYKETAQALLDKAHHQFQKIISALRSQIEQRWGSKETKVSTTREYVKYTQNYQSRAIVNFDDGTVIIETLDQDNPRESLKEAIKTTLLTPDDPRSVDLFSDRQVKLNTQHKPYLYGLIVDQNGQTIYSAELANHYAAYLLSEKVKTRTVNANGKKRPSLFVKLHMVKNYESMQAEKYRHFVDTYAAKFGISKSLVYAIIKTESNFNPFAVSSAPAYGLMQLVPSSGGHDGYKKARSRDETPSRDSLFDPETNIELGVAYLSVLKYDLLDDISDNTSREYCVISAYNTGTGNVTKAFSNNRGTAISTINGLTPPGVYSELVKNLPYQETRLYLPKVVQHRKQFTQF